MFFEDKEEFTKHGYYLVNGIKTLSKFEAWQISKGDFNNIQFIYNNELMSSYDWSTEPTENIYDLYTERARQIRAKYDYVVLLYSGGIDSHTILETFLQNDIKLDEICTLNNTDVESKTSKFNQEVFNRAIPFVQSLDLKKLGTKFRLVDIGEIILNQYSDTYHFENHHYYTNGPGSNWSNAARSHVLKLKMKEHIVLSEQGKTVCYIWGFDKPVITIEDDKYCLKFSDSAIDLNVRQYINRSVYQNVLANFYDEPFFITKDCPKISIKQAHLLVNYMKTISASDTRLLSQDELANTGPFVVHHKNQYYRFLSKKMVDGVLYPNALLNSFKDDKVKGSVMLTSRDNWFNLSDHNNQHRWIQNLNKLLTTNHGFYLFKNNKVVIPNHVLSNPYYIGPINVFS
jgi:hypothetical protein